MEWVDSRIVILRRDKATSGAVSVMSGGSAVFVEAELGTRAGAVLARAASVGDRVVHGLDEGRAAARELGRRGAQEQTRRSLRRVRVAIGGKRIAHAEHELDGVTERLPEEQEETEVHRQVHARHERHDRVVDEKRAIKHELRLVGRQHVRDGERNLSSPITSISVSVRVRIGAVLLDISRRQEQWQRA